MWVVPALLAGTTTSSYPASEGISVLLGSDIPYTCSDYLGVLGNMLIRFGTQRHPCGDVYIQVTCKDLQI